MTGITIDISNINEHVIQKYDLVNIENCTYANYLTKPFDVDVSSFNRLIDKTVIIEGPFEDINAISKETEVQVIAYKRILKSIQFAKELNAKGIIFKLNYSPHLKDKLYRNYFIKESISFWKSIIKKNPTIEFYFSNLYDENPKVLLRILKGLKLENAYIAFDMIHALAYSKVDVLQFFEELKPYINTAIVPETLIIDHQIVPTTMYTFENYFDLKNHTNLINLIIKTL